ncbi:hypothetical protein QAD02_013796 [Eretmocerus hayati]|uniref:Uncharacterized protein n=1 Tax=Eretmocerus hayati TaxID=131215 RepID=A0ACC2P348_9HYME|nr:hypothetical protein QAD02_013796 [Eretmocerus hayati]
MAFLHSASNEWLEEDFSLIEIPPTQTTIESSQWVTYKPISTLSDDSPIEFSILSSGVDYIDLAHILLSLRVKIRNSTGEKLPEDDVVRPVENFLRFMLNQVDVFFNQKLVTPTNNNYAYES